MNLTEQFGQKAEQFARELSEAVSIKEVEEAFRAKNMLAAACGSDRFRQIYYAYLTAQVSQRWSYCCLDQGIESKEIQNLFFKTVLDLYAREKDLESASHFSEAMYAANSNAEQATLISILTAFFKKVSDGQAQVSAESTAELFRLVAGVWDGYCHYIENSFDDFLAELRLQGALSQEKRG